MSSSQGNFSTPIMKAPSRFLEAVLALAIKTGDKVLEIYHSNFRVGQLPDQSPLTAANLVSHHLLTEALFALNGGFPVLSQLSSMPPFEERREWETYWLIGPLDGTLEFTRHIGEFTINIALIHQHKPVLGVVYAPALQICYFAAEGCGAFKKLGEDDPQEIHVRMQAPNQPDVVGSRFHPNLGMEVYLKQLGEHHFNPLGSSLKFCQVATGEADLYPRMGITCEWDTAAAQCIVETAGGAITDLQGRPLIYNAKSSLVNPFFLAFGDKARDWTRFAKGITGSPSSAPPPPSPLLKAVINLVIEAGNRVLAIHSSNVRVGTKADGSPFTAADLVSHHYLTERLETLQGHLPVLSGESHDVPFEERSLWEDYWLIDPLNGVEEFIKGNGEFTINVALIHRNKPVLGVVYAPSLRTCFFSAEGCGVFKRIGEDPATEIRPKARSQLRPVALISDPELNPDLKSYLNHLGEHELVCCGSSLKFCKIAEGEADLYACLTSSYEWETAAAQYIVEAVGGKVEDQRGEPLLYNTKASLLNPYFVVSTDTSRDRKLLGFNVQTLQKLLAA